jgi:radical SAM superfamily enzyme YgiQ (UPF0313 family)
MPLFLADSRPGRRRRSTQTRGRRTSRSRPTPRFELLKFDRYNHIGIQWCRGCPFSCEFCDIIELFGKVPRAKSSTQILAELQKLLRPRLPRPRRPGRRQLHREQEAGEAVPPDLKKWLEERNWPFEFTTEASINLADDTALMKAMQEVGFFAIFVGIESPDETTLGRDAEAAEHPPLDRGVDPQDLRHGMFVNAGFIIGLRHGEGERRARASSTASRRRASR